MNSLNFCFLGMFFNLPFISEEQLCCLQQPWFRIIFFSIYFFNFIYSFLNVSSFSLLAYKVSIEQCNLNFMELLYSMAHFFSCSFQNSYFLSFHNLLVICISVAHYTYLGSLGLMNLNARISVHNWITFQPLLFNNTFHFISILIQRLP